MKIKLVLNISVYTSVTPLNTLNPWTNVRHISRGQEIMCHGSPRPHSAVAQKLPRLSQPSGEGNTRGDFRPARGPLFMEQLFPPRPSPSRARRTTTSLDSVNGHGNHRDMSIQCKYLPHVTCQKGTTGPWSRPLSPTTMTHARE
jgi:hypothetical protein